MTTKWTTESRERHRELTRQHYEANKQYYKDKAKKSKAKLLESNYEKLWEYLKLHPCVDCGETDIMILQFDHVRGDKTGNISRLIQAWSWFKLEGEIAKCDVRCANCHVRKTRKQLGWRNNLE